MTKIKTSRDKESFHFSYNISSDKYISNWFVRGDEIYSFGILSESFRNRKYFFLSR
jgi:hypothetical protein